MHTVPGSPAPCAVCGATRSRLEAARGKVCGEWTCQVEQVKRDKAAEAAVFKEKCNEIAADYAAQSGSEAIPARVPYLGRPVVETPPAEKLAFRTFLRASLRETAGKAGDGTVAPIPEEEDAPTPVLDASCIACRGFCCRQGAGHAFLKPEYLPTVLWRRPGDSPAVIYRDYIRRIPEKSMQDACLYQGEQGCVLPRDMRSYVCNSFECEDRLNLKMALEGQEGASALVIAMDGDSVKAAAIAAPGEPLDWIET